MSSAQGDLHNKDYHGSCLCGSVKFKARHFKPHLGHCHCSDCRKFHGAAFSTFVEVALADFQWLEGEEYVTSFVAANFSTRQFCSRCGSSLTFFSKSAQGKSIELALAAFDEQPDVRPDAHIFVESKVPWFELNDGLVQHSRNRS